MTFTITIQLSNDTVRSPTDVADALATVTRRLLAVHRVHSRLAPRASAEPQDIHVDAGPIHDTNGNTVGEYAFRGSP